MPAAVTSAEGAFQNAACSSSDASSVRVPGIHSASATLVGLQF